jgi:putative SOS response-associated peptidase YedK
MCGRYISTTTPDRLGEIFDASTVSFEFSPRYNLAPGALAPIVSSDADQRVIEVHRWGLVPHWSKEDIGTRLSNARGETVGEKPSFRDAFRRHRVVVPMDGFYEWAPAHPDGPRTRSGRPAKRPHLFSSVDGEVLNVAGIASIWRQGAGELRTFAVVTTEANATMAPIHDRMPVLLDRDGVDRWLDPDDQPEDLIRPASEELLEMWEVATEVNDARNEGAHLMEPIESAPSTLF